jgi:diguanylate cyclase (GGDEF)-like protein/PAS domain S-box-containing protein
VTDLTTDLGAEGPGNKAEVGWRRTRIGSAGTRALGFAELDELLEPLGEVLLLVETSGTIVYASPAVRKRLGFTAHAVEGRELFDLFPPGAARDALIPLVEHDAEEPDPANPVQVRLVDARGVARLVTVTRCSAPHLAERDLVGFVVREGGFGRSTLDALRQRLAFEDLLTRVASSFILRPSHEIDAGIEEALADIGSFGDVDRVYLYVADDQGAKVESTHVWNSPSLDEDRQRVRVIHDVDAPAWMSQLRRLEPVYVPRVADLGPEWEAERELLRGEGVQSALALPLADGARFLGFIGFDSITTERMWSDDHVSLLSSAAGIISQALARRSAEQRFVLAFTAAPLGMALNSGDGHFLQVNETFCALLDRDEDELLGSSGLDVVDAADRTRLLRGYRQLVEGTTDRVSMELRSVRSDGSTRWLRTHIAVVRLNDGSIRYLITHLEDITERHQQEMELRVSEERYRSLVENSPAVVTRFDRDGHLVYVSPTFEEISGVAVEEVLGQPSEAFEFGGDRERWTSILQRVVDTGQRHDSEWSIVVGDDELWFQSRAVPELSQHGDVEHVLVMSTDITALKRSEAELVHQALHDPLTGLANRALLLDHLSTALAQRQRRPEPLAVLFLDLDRFKVINDSLGHTAGDRLLVEVGRRLEAALRAGDTVARLGGDEFVMLLPDVGSAEEAMAIAERVLREVSRPVQLDSEEVYTTASIGIALAHGGDHATADNLLRDSDTAMYRAKARGRDRYELFDEELRTQATTRLHLEMFLRRAVDLGELQVHYQPEVDLEQNRVVGAEALVRWRHPIEGLLDAGAFISLAEETGLILEVGRWVLREACHQAGRWQRELPGRLNLLRVNLSARQIAQPDLVDIVVRALDDAGLAPSSLCLEITETALMADASASLDVLTRLRELGIVLAIDDFGTGYSSLSYLKRFPVDVLKIDRSFVEGLGRDADATAITHAILSLGKALGLCVVAEGVESLEQLSVLRQLGCHRAQGFLFSAAVPADEFWSVDADCARVLA